MNSVSFLHEMYNDEYSERSVKKMNAENACNTKTIYKNYSLEK